MPRNKYKLVGLQGSVSRRTSLDWGHGKGQARRELMLESIGGCSTEGLAGWRSFSQKYSVNFYPLLSAKPMAMHRSDNKFPIGLTSHTEENHRVIRIRY